MAKSWARGDYPLPDFLRNAPVLHPRLQLWWGAFWDLCGDRAGMGDGRLLWTATHLWARAHDLSSEQEWHLCYVLRQMDTVFMQHQKEVADRGSK